MVTLRPRLPLKKEVLVQSGNVDKLERINYAKSNVTANLLHHLRKFNVKLLKRENSTSSPRWQRYLAEVNSLNKKQLSNVTQRHHHLCPSTFTLVVVTSSSLDDTTSMKKVVMPSVTRSSASFPVKTPEEN